MYKKLHIFALMALVLVSCSKQEVLSGVAVQFNASICPDMTVLVRGGAEPGPEAVIADRAVLQAWRGNQMAIESVQDIPAGTTQISFSGIKLAAGVEYLIYIWAGCNGYYDTGDLRSVSVKQDKLYDGKTAAFDAFYSCSAVTCSQDDEVHPVTLRRPFAKVVFSADADSPLTVNFTAPTTLNLATGEVSGTREAEYTVQPEGTGVTAFDYIFAPEDVTQVGYTFKLGYEEPKTASVPIARNTKTNIILTN